MQAGEGGRRSNASESSVRDKPTLSHKMIRDQRVGGGDSDRSGWAER